MSTQSIDRTLVHKDDQTAVLLSSATRISDGNWLIGIALPRDHPTASQSASGFATLLAAELIRQTAIAFAHLDGKVPLGWAFLLHELSFSWHENPLTVAGPTALDAHLDVKVHTRKKRKGELSDLQLSATLNSNGVLLGSGYGDLSCLPPTVYKAIRRNAPSVSQVSTSASGNVLANLHIDDDALDAELVWNWQDPFIFDHFSDHLPGMLLSQAILEAHQALTGSDASRLHLRCGTFGEFNSPVQVKGEATSSGDTVVAITQNGQHLATGHCSNATTTLDDPDAAPVFLREIAAAR